MSSWIVEKGSLIELLHSCLTNLYYDIPEVAPSKLSEEEHSDMFIYPITRSFHGSEKNIHLD
ncbi:8814_t:CDS:2 [Acaulospora morrowiae]|uniref:8814_t:CDS:1 n=1 Tax=Acaulospora morrowiae TaxID=94023 RepID=A0A9N9FEY3_9GLOM|nr:8814_t:CDS:2 [Acaulospora morrowiae]